MWFWGLKRGCLPHWVVGGWGSNEATHRGAQWGQRRQVQEGGVELGAVVFEVSVKQQKGCDVLGAVRYRDPVHRLPRKPPLL